VGLLPGFRNFDWLVGCPQTLESRLTLELNLLNYYGLDWLAMILGFTGMWLLGKKRKISFIFTAVGMVSAFSVSILSSQYGFMVANSIMFFLAIRNYILWSKEEKV